MCSLIKDTVAQSADNYFVYHSNYIGNNYIDSEGCTHLSKSQWHNMILLYLGIALIMKMAIRLDSKDMDTSKQWDVKSGVTINTKKNDDDAIQITIIHIYLFAVILLHL